MHTMGKVSKYRHEVLCLLASVSIVILISINQRLDLHNQIWVKFNNIWKPGINSFNKTLIRKNAANKTREVNDLSGSLPSLNNCLGKNRIPITLQQNFTCTHFMTIAGRIGRTGNQLFQVATLVATAIKHGYTPIIHRYYPLAALFNLPNVYNVKLSNTKSFYEDRCCAFSNGIETLDHNQNWTLYGYFQSWKYFQRQENIIRRVIKLKEIFIQEAKVFLNKTSLPGFINVCLHNRRGDKLRAVAKGHAVANVSFIQRAMDYYKNKSDLVQFIILSDNMSWCKQHIRGDHVIYSPFSRRAGTDLALMSMCDHVIVTAGTFGWWGAWLSGRKAVYLNAYPTPGSELAHMLNRTEYYPPNWIGL